MSPGDLLKESVVLLHAGGGQVEGVHVVSEYDNVCAWGGEVVQGKHRLCFVEPSLLFPRCMRLGEHEILCVAA